MNDSIKFRSYHDLIEYRAKTVGDNSYILYENDKITFSDFYASTCCAANGLTKHGAKPGDGVAIIMGNCPEYLYLYLWYGPSRILQCAGKHLSEERRAKVYSKPL